VSLHLHGWGRVAGNREVSRCAGCADGTAGEKGGPWGKQGFPHESAAEPRDGVEVDA